MGDAGQLSRILETFRQDATEEIDRLTQQAGKQDRDGTAAAALALKEIATDLSADTLQRLLAHLENKITQAEKFDEIECDLEGIKQELDRCLGTIPSVWDRFIQQGKGLAQSAKEH